MSSGGLLAAMLLDFLVSVKHDDDVESKQSQYGLRIATRKKKKVKRERQRRKLYRDRGPRIKDLKR